MASTGLEQLRSLQNQLNTLIDDYAQAESKSPLFGLNEVGKEVSLEPQDPQLAKLATTLNQMQAVVLGDKLPFQRAFEFHVIGCLNVAVDAHVEEFLREAWNRGVKSLSSDELAKPTGIDANKLARCLRLLASYHIFTESETNVFSRNRCSASLDSGVSVEELVKDPLAKYSSERGGIGAIIGHFAQEGMRSDSYMSESLLSSTGPRDYGFSRAYDGQKIWEYFARDENESKRKRFHCGTGAMFKYLNREESVLLGFPWASLPEGSTICDVAGRTGNVSLEIAQAVPHLEFVVQDQESIIKAHAIPYWEAPERQAYKERVKLVVHDFFDPQPTKGAAVYLIRMALHGFNDDQVTQVLSNFAAAADQSSKLIIIEGVYESLATPGVYPPSTATPYLLDLQMLSIINVRERLEAQYVSLAGRAGWKHVKTWKTGKDGQDGIFRHYEFALQ
ncbi:hypothetical protein JCM3765_000235 [Sporobolomyces pararoseus]